MHRNVVSLKCKQKGKNGVPKGKILTEGKLQFSNLKKKMLNVISKKGKVDMQITICGLLI